MWLEHQTAPICDSSSTIRAFFHLKGSRKLKRKKKKIIDYTTFLDLKKAYIFIYVYSITNELIVLCYIII